MVTTAMLVGGGVEPVVMGSLISAGGGWKSPGGHAVCFFVMAGCAAVGAALALLTRSSGARLTGTPAGRDERLQVRQG